jgi:restriction endonuclease S subunit
MREGWVETTLGDVAKVTSGFAFSTKSWKEHGIPVIKINNVRNGQVSIENCSYIQEPVPEGASKFLLKQGDLLITLTGEIGAIGFVTQSLPMYLNQRVGRLDLLAREKVSLEFIGLFLSLPEVRAEMWSHGKGNAQLNISPTSIQSLTINLPPIPEQKRIVDLISSVDLYLESLRAALAKSISARKSALESQLESLNKTSPIFRLEELCAAGKSAIVDGPFGANLKREDYLEEGIPVLKIQNIKQDDVVIKKMDYVSEDKYQELRRHSFQKGDIVMTKLGDPLGLSAIVRGLDKGLIVADLVRIRPDKIDVEFLCIQLNSAKIQNYINRMQKGSTRPRVNLGMIREMPIMVPNENEINDFISVFGAWGEQNRKLEETIHSTEQLRSSLLSDLLSGKHEIPASYDKVMGAA